MGSGLMETAFEVPGLARNALDATGGRTPVLFW